MKTFIKKLTASLGLLAILVLPTSASAQETPPVITDEKINNYIVDITVNKDSSIRVEEKITYDFGTAEKHGIFRDIPYRYKARGGTFSLRISDIEVKDAGGDDHNFSQSSSGGNLQLKIGDADKFVTGIQQYNINYTVKRAINYFDDHEELYWNAIGTGWPVPILQSKVTLHLPAASNGSQCYIGALGSTETLCTIFDNKIDAVEYTYAKPLAAGDGFTITASLPAGSVVKPTQLQNILEIVRDNYILALPLLVFGIMFHLWREYGKDAKGKGTIVPQFEPPADLTPLQMGMIVDNKFHNRDLTAEIVHYATTGYVKIDREETRAIIFKGSDYKLTTTKPTSDLNPKAQILLGFVSSNEGVKLSELKNNTTFTSYISKLPNEVFKELKADGYYRYNPSTIKGITIAAGIIFAAAGTVLLAKILGSLSIVAFVVSGLIIVAFGFIMPALTKKGAEMREYILGLKKYLSVAEKDRLEFHNAPEKNPQMFEKLLPYAIALGVEKQWAKQFEGIYNSRPSWYNDSTTSTGFNPVMFTSSVTDFSSSMQSSLKSVTTAASGGSGFSGGGSGGGGGGGGGGSW